MKKIVLVSHGFQPDYEAGFANGLARNGVEVTLISADRTLGERLSPAVRTLNLRGSQDNSRPAWLKVLNLVWYVLSLFVFLLLCRPTIHLSGLFLSGSVKWWPIECRIYRLLGRRLVLTVHNVVPHDCDSPSVRAVLRELYAIPDVLVVHTQKARLRLFDEFGVSRERVIVMEHGIDSIIALPDAQMLAVRESLSVKGDGRLILFFGAVMPYKGVDLLIEAAALLPENMRVHIAGRCGDAGYQAQLDKLLAPPGARASITWENAYLSEDRASELLASADVLVMPYRHIDQSGVLFAALRHGTPIVAFDVGSFRDYLPEGAGQVVQAGDIKALAAAIEDVCAAPTTRGGIHALAECYLWERTVRPVLDIYAN